MYTPFFSSILNSTPFCPPKFKELLTPPPRARPHRKYLDRAILVIQVIVCFTIKGSQRQPNFLIKQYQTGPYTYELNRTTSDVHWSSEQHPLEILARPTPDQGILR